MIRIEIFDEGKGIMSNIGWDDLFAKMRDTIEQGSENPARFMEVSSLFDEIPNLLLYDDSSAGVSLVHYTTWENALNIFGPEAESPVLRMYNYEQSNDPDEGQIVPLEWKEAIDEANWLDDYMGRGNLWKR